MQQANNIGEVNILKPLNKEPEEISVLSIKLDHIHMNSGNISQIGSSCLSDVSYLTFGYLIMSHVQ